MSKTKLPVIAFLGLGIMGLPMAGRLAAAGYSIRLWNRNTARVNELNHPNAIGAQSPSSAMEGADIAIIMLSTGPVIDQVLFTPDNSGSIPANMLSSGTLVVVMSSIPVETARDQAERLAKRGVRYLDAPVSGGEHGAKEGTLTIMVGGDVDDFSDTVEIFKPLGTPTYVGPTGSGQLAKLANQLIVGVTIGAVSEALLLAKTGGADPAAVRKALLGGFADSTILRQHGERIVKQDFVPGAHASTQLKDLTTAKNLADSVGCKLPFLALCQDQFAAMCAHGMSNVDHSGLFLELEQASGKPPKDS